MSMDPGHDETDELLAKIEKRVNAEYKQAAKEAQKKLDDYLKRFDAKDKRWKAMVDSGEKTQEEYQKWRQGQIMIGKRWEDLRDTLAQDYHNANLIARSTVDGYMPDVYAINHNYGTYQVESSALVDTSYALYDRQTVERIMLDQPDLLPPPGKDLAKKIAENKDLAWQEGKIQSITLQSILQGESIPKMAKRISTDLAVANNKNAVRYARTSVTGAENAGRVDSYRRAQNMGIKMKQMWIATLDGRTRHEHRQLDGQTVTVGEPFKVDGEEIRFPGDPAAPGYLVWNCRCTLVAQLEGFETDPADMGLRYDEKLGEMSYDEWKKAKK